MALKNNRLIALWLAVTLALLSVFAAVHSLQHMDGGINNHCTLCVHQQQLNKLLPGKFPELPVSHFVPVRHSCLTPGLHAVPGYFNFGQGPPRHA
ncbi:hypothetical protein [Shewanella cyperi]|uniref:hypothetical protein n=1 Tax=Shewanella cyperi TaxID=2814292 RepID=UPI001A93F02B|nr:hypothetical protein [Shewanella cyperi]QSX40365.1 hypothetical protein JYB84_15580 [Shewanella cyperi]